MIYKSTHQPTAQERLGDFKAKAVYVPELNPVRHNIFGQRFHNDFSSIFGESK